MGIRKIVGNIFSILGNVSSVLYFLEIFGLIHTPLLEVTENMANYLAVLVLVVFVVSTYWICYQVVLWRTKKQTQMIVSERVPSSTSKAEGAVEIGGRVFKSQLYLTKDLGSLEHLLTKPVSGGNLWLMGISLNQFGERSRDPVAALLKRDVNLRILVLKPEKSGGDLVQRFISDAGASVTEGQINDTIRYFKSLDEYGKKLQIKQHNSLPFHTMIIVDDSFIQVGFYLYKKGPSSRPQAIVCKSLSSEIFDLLKGSYDELWKMAEPV